MLRKADNFDTDASSDGAPTDRSLVNIGLIIQLSKQMTWARIHRSAPIGKCVASHEDEL